jgi:urea transporter
MTTASLNRTRALDDGARSWWVPAIFVGMVVAGWISLAVSDQPATDRVADDQAVLQRCLQAVSGMTMLREIVELKSCLAANGHPLGE